MFSVRSAGRVMVKGAGWICQAKYALLAAAYFSLAGLPTHAWAAGFTVYSQGTAAMGQGNAFVAEANDPSTIFYNPAGLNQLQRPEIYAMVLVSSPKREFRGHTGHSSQTHQVFLPSGAFYLVYPVNSSVVLGFGAYAPFGQESRWPDSWEGRYITTYGNLKTYNLNPVISVQLHPRLSIALGLDAMLSTVRLKRKVALPFNLPDGDSKLQGEGYGFGFNLGMLLEVMEGIKFGLSYRYQTDITYEGDLELPQPAGFGLMQVKLPASAKLTFPPMVTMGLSVSRCQPFVFNFDVTWTGWSTFNAIDVRPSQPIIFNGVPTTALVQPRDWHDAWTFRFGMNYRVTDRVKLRLGYTYDLSAIPNSTFDPQIINANQHIFTLGGDLKLNRFTLGLAYNYLLGESRSKNNMITTNGVPAPLQANGSYQGTAQGLGLSLAYYF